MIFLQSDNTPIWISYSRTKHRYDFRKYIVLRTRSCTPKSHVIAGMTHKKIPSLLKCREIYKLLSITTKNSFPRRLYVGNILNQDVNQNINTSKQSIYM